jgi:LemA protein
MYERGVLTKEQAARLSESLVYNPKAEQSSSRSSRPLALLVATVAIVTVVIAIWLTMSPAPDMTDTTTEIQRVQTVLNQPQEIGTMGKAITGGLSVALFILIPLLLLLIWVIYLYNGLVEKEEAVFKSWAQVESNYQRRADLIPNMLETVSKYMSFEKETLTTVVAERSQGISPETFSEEDQVTFEAAMDKLSKARETSTRAMQAIDSAPDNEAELERLHAAENVIGTSMHRIMALAENYPVLRSADQMLTLQAELEGSENRINVARIRFNEAASEFNAGIRQMPASLIASMGGFKRKAYFQADDGTDKAVQIKFD